MQDRSSSQLSLFNPEQDIRIIEFRESVARDLYVANQVVDWNHIEERTQELSKAIRALEQLLNQGAYRNPENVAACIADEPTVIHAISLIMALPSHLDFADGRSFPKKAPTEKSELLELAALVDEIGVWTLLEPETHLESLVKTALVADDAQRRRFRLRRNTEHRLWEILERSCLEASSRLGLQLALLSEKSQFPTVTRAKADYLVVAENRTVAAIRKVIQTRTGGRQQRDLRLTYPVLQQELDAEGIKLILIADGQGIYDTPASVLAELMLSLHAVMSIEQANRGSLTDALISAYMGEGKPAAPISRIIESILMTGKPVIAATLPVPFDEARLAMGAFISEHADLALSLEAGGEKLDWKHAKLVQAALELREEFHETAALDLFTGLLGASIVRTLEENDELGLASILATEALPFLPEKLLVVSNKGEPDERAIREVAQQALRHDAKLAVLITSGRTNEGTFNRLDHIQRTLARNVIVISAHMLLRWSMADKHPYELFATCVLEQSDLAKITPFVLQGRTPDRMYFGRAVEEATALHALSSNSLAITGSRRSGKTSLMHRIARQLNSSGYYAMFADCQTVHDWVDFGRIAEETWEIELPEEFRPNHLFSLVHQLQSRAAGLSIVILLDEIDQLLQWDTVHSDSKVPEAFFKTCRTVSQAGDAQFVFSGERTIAARLWDPHSPHWNFCREVPLMQLDRESTEQLILQPLESLGISIRDATTFKKLVWAYTSGHPQIAQLLGDSLIRNLNLRDREERYYLEPSDVEAVAETFEFKEHYIETYWGQATKTERLITLLVVGGICSPSAIIEEFRMHSASDFQPRVADAIRMLQLYGIFEQEGDEIRLRAEWLPYAIRSYGNPDVLINEYWTSVQ